MPDEEYAPPKYAQIVQAVRRRIADGTYPPGSLLPSEAQLIREFAVSRPTVVRALQVLQLRGVIDREHGKGSYVKASPPTSDEDSSRPGRAVVDRVEADEGGTIVEAGSRPAPANVAALLSLPEGAPVVMRRIVFSDAAQPCELVTFWCPIELAEGTELGRDRPLSVSVRQHVQAVKAVRFDHVVERLAARHPVGYEAKLLELDASAPVLAVLARILDGSGRPMLIVDVVLPGTLHELEDVYGL